MKSLRASFLVAAIALALFGLGRFLFNLVTVRVFGPEFVGEVNVALSGWTVVTVLLGTVPALLTSKFVAESIALGNEVRAKRIYSASLAAALVPGLIVAVAASVVAASENRLWSWYVPIFAAYLVTKAAAFAFARQRAYVISEATGFAAFLLLLVTGCVVGSTRIVELSLLLHPAIIVAVMTWNLRREVVGSGLVRELTDEWRRYSAFSGASAVNAAAGLVSYHLAVVLAGFLLADRASVGYLSVLLSSLSPLNFLPTALGTSLFPELARRHGAGDEAGQRRAVARSVIALQTVVCTAGTALLLAPEPALLAMHLPVDSSVRVTWVLLAWALQVSIVSSPCGHYLNATRFAARHAVASLWFLLIGLAVGIAGLVMIGLVGAAIMRVGVDVGLAWTRMLMAERSLRWSGGIRGAVVGCHVALAAAMVAGLLAPAWPWRLAIWLGGIGAQFQVARGALAAATREPA
jgi:O-antigen/teichoic acid export membrane protein